MFLFRIGMGEVDRSPGNHPDGKYRGNMENETVICIDTNVDRILFLRKNGHRTKTHSFDSVADCAFRLNVPMEIGKIREMTHANFRSNRKTNMHIRRFGVIRFFNFVINSVSHFTLL